MDRIDRQIVHCLQRDGRASFRRIAEVLAVSEQTVARRVRALEGDGTMRVLVLPDARAAGEKLWFVRIRCRPDAADPLADALADRDDVAWVSIAGGGGEIVCTTSSHPRQDRGSVLLERLPRTHQVLGFAAHAVLHMHVGGESELFAFDDPLTPDQISRLLAGVPDRATGTRRPTVDLRDDDGPLLAELARDGRAGVVALARATGWPASRVSARLDELLVGGAVHVEIDLALSRLGLHTIALVWLTVAPAELEVVGQALARHPGTSFAAAVTGTANLLTAVACRDDDELYSYVTTQVGALPGVRQAEVVPALRRVKQARSRQRDGRLEPVS